MPVAANPNQPPKIIQQQRLRNKMNAPEWQKPENIKDAKPCNVNLLPEDKERLRVAGHGSIAQGVRVVLAAYRETGK